MTAAIIERKPSAVQLRVEIPWQEYLVFAEKAARRLSKAKTVNGFRAGNAPYWAAARDLGAMTVLEEAFADAVPATLAQTLQTEKLETVGEPSIQLEKLAPENPVSYTASVLLLPSVEVGDLSRISCAAQPTTVDPSEVDRVLEGLRAMHAAERPVDRAAGKTDAVTVDLSMSVGGVPVEGGSAKGNIVHLDRTHYVPGFPEQLIGMRKGESKKFALEFPKEHFQRHLAGRMVDFEVSMTEVRDRLLPPADDGLATRIGQPTLEKLRTLITGNLAQEKQEKEQTRFEQELLRCVLEKTRFGEIPDFLPTREAQRMLAELEESVSRDGGTFEDYLQHLKKSRADLLLDFAPKAFERVKGALLLRSLAKRENIAVSDEEVERDIASAKKVYEKNPEIMEMLDREHVREEIRARLRNKKVIDWLKARIDRSNH